MQERQKLEDVLAVLLAERGREILKDPKQFRALLKDALAEDGRRFHQEVECLAIAIEEGVSGLLNLEEDDAALSRHLVDRVVSRGPLRECAEWAVKALGLNQGPSHSDATIPRTPTEGDASSQNAHPSPSEVIRARRRSRIRIIVLVVAALILAIPINFVASVSMPEAVPVAMTSIVYDAAGRMIGNFHGDENRTIVDLNAMSDNLKEAVVASQDRSFFGHSGISIKSMLRAAFTSQDMESHALTITQQYARTFASTGDSDWERKLKTSILAVKLEGEYTKDKILELYLNSVPFGRGAFGAEAAAHTYFKKPARELDLAEAAYLAGIVRSPDLYQIEENRDGIDHVKHRVLDSMLDVGYIDESTREAARKVDMAGRFKFGESFEQDSPRAGYFVEYVKQHLLRDLQIPETDLLRGGLTIHTSLDLRMQDAAEAAVSSTINLPTDPEVALIAMDPEGNVKAMVGGRVVNDSERAKGFNFAANPPGEDGGRQPGTAAMPIALAAFLDAGKSANSVFRSPSTIELDRVRCPTEGTRPVQASNFVEADFGNMNMVEATINASRTVYAQVMEQVVGPAGFVKMAEKVGMSVTEKEKGCLLALGTSYVTPLEMARVYATFAAGGRRPEPRAVVKVLAADGTAMFEHTPRIEQTVDQNTANTVSWILKQNIQRGNGTAAKLDYPAMGMAGTTMSKQDAYFAGSTPELTAVVWMGYEPVDDPDTTSGTVKKVNPPMTDVHGREVTGGSFPAQIWKKFMSVALQDRMHSNFSTPQLLGDVMQPAAEAPAP